MVQRIAAMKERVIDLTQAEQHKLQIRLNKIKGQLASIEGTLARPVECSGTLQQLAAVSGALKSMMREILEISVRSKVECIQQEDAARNADEIIEAMRSFLK